MKLPMPRMQNSTQDPWKSVLRTLKGRIGHDGVERIATVHMFDELEIPLRRRPSLTVRLSRVMQKLLMQGQCWSPEVSILVRFAIACAASRARSPSK